MYELKLHRVWISSYQSSTMAQVICSFTDSKSLKGSDHLLICKTSILLPCRRAPLVDGRCRSSTAVGGSAFGFCSSLIRCRPCTKEQATNHGQRSCANMCSLRNLDVSFCALENNRTTDVNVFFTDGMAN